MRKILISEPNRDTDYQLSIKEKAENINFFQNQGVLWMSSTGQN